MSIDRPIEQYKTSTESVRTKSLASLVPKLKYDISKKNTLLL